MTTATPDTSLSDALTTLVQNTPGVTRLYMPTRAVPVLGTAHRVLTELGTPVPAAHVIVDPARGTVSASVGIDLSRSAVEIGETVCTRIREQLALTGQDMNVKVTIAYITG